MIATQTSSAAPSSADLAGLIRSIAETADRDAFAALYEHFAPRVKSYLVRLGSPQTVAEELAQEALLTVWRKAAYFDPAKAGASTWVFTIARNLRIDQGRRNRAAAGFEPDPADRPDDVPTPDDALIASEREEKVRIAITALSTEQAEIVRLLYLRDNSHSEIAKSLGIPLGTVKSRARLAIARLRTLLDDLK